jgi:hypothetical protein
VFSWIRTVIAATRWQHVRRITFYVLLMFAGFVIVWLMLITKVRSGVINWPSLVTEVEVHSLEARWGLNILTLPIMAASIAVVRRRRRELGDVTIALIVGLVTAVGMAYFPSAVMGGHIPWPFTTSYFDTNGYIDLSLIYATGAAALLLIIHRMASTFRSARRS